MQSAGGRNPGMRGENGGIGDQTEMSGNGMEKLSQGAEFKDSGKRAGTLGRSGRYYQIYNPLLNLMA